MSKFVTSIKSRLLERAQMDERWVAAYAAFEFARQHHTGWRKDNTTPEFHHQLAIVSEVLAIAPPDDALVLVIGALLHDISEDYKIHKFEIKERFGVEVANLVESVTKKFDGEKKDIVAYYAHIATIKNSAIIKGFDRLVNIESMNNLKPDGTPVFTLEKQKSYITETNALVIPMLKEAQKNFPEAHRIFNGIIQRLRVSMGIIQSFHHQIETLQNKMDEDISISTSPSPGR